MLRNTYSRQNYACPSNLRNVIFECLIIICRDNNSTDSNRSPQTDKKSKTLSEVKSDVKQSMAQKSVSKTKVIPPQPKRK